MPLFRAGIVPGLLLSLLCRQQAVFARTFSPTQKRKLNLAQSERFFYRGKAKTSRTHAGEAALGACGLRGGGRPESPQRGAQRPFNALPMDKLRL